jgi:hypothetical protein
MSENTGVKTGDAPSVGNLARELDKIGEGAFRQKYQHPFLVVVYKPPGDVVEEADARTVESRFTDFSPEASKWFIVEAITALKSERCASESCITVGRADSNDIVLSGSNISKRHAEFIKDKDRWHLVDLGSANGTAVNGNKLKENTKVKIKSKDVIAFWRYTFEFHDTDSFIKFLLEEVLLRE